MGTNAIMKRANLMVLWAVMGLAMLTHIVYIAQNQSHLSDDTASYLDPANNIRSGLGFVNNAHQPEIWRPPGYPLVLALFQSKPLQLDYLVPVQHILCILLAVAVAAFGLRITGNSMIAMVAGSVLSLDMATILVADLLLSEVIFTTCIALACWILHSAISKPVCNLLEIAVAGLLAGFAVLVRPVGILYFIPLLIYILIALKRHVLRPVLVFAVCSLFFPLLLAGRNFMEARYFGVSTTGEYNLLANRAAGAVAIQQPGSYFDNVVAVRHELLSQTCADFKRVHNQDCAPILEAPAQQAAFFAHAGTRIISKNLPGYIQSVVVGAAYTMFGGGAEALMRIGHFSSRTAEYIVLAVTIPEACLALLGCWYWFQHDRALCSLFVLTVLYFLLISSGAEAYSRYRVPVMPMYALLIGGGAAIAGQRIKALLLRTVFSYGA